MENNLLDNLHFRTIKKSSNNIFFLLILLIGTIISYFFSEYVFCIFLFILTLNIITEISSRNIDSLIIYEDKEEIQFHFFNLIKKWNVSYKFKDIKFVRKREFFGRTGLSDYLKFTLENEHPIILTHNDFDTETLNLIHEILKKQKNKVPPLSPESFLVVNNN